MKYQEVIKKYKLENLRSAELRGADLRSADLREVILYNTDLRGADLRRADLRYADLRGADLRDVILYNTDLHYANLRGADLRGTDLLNADLRCVDLHSAAVTVIYGEEYFISICQDVVRAGCQQHTIEDWRSFSKLKVAEMDGKKSLKYYPRLLDLIDFYCGKGKRPDWINEGNN